MADKPKIGDILGGMGKSAAKDPLMALPESPEEEDTEVTSPEEVDAMKLFAKASTPEQKASALKMFLKACGVY
jgi:hypothetical protein